MDKCHCKHDTFQTRNWLKAFSKEKKRWWCWGFLLSFHSLFIFDVHSATDVCLSKCSVQIIWSRVSEGAMPASWLSCINIRKSIVNSLVPCFLLAVSISEEMRQCVITLFSVGICELYNNKRVKISFSAYIQLQCFYNYYWFFLWHRRS